MHRYNIDSRILLILTVITFALAAPALIQDKRQARVDVVHVPEDVITVLGKRTVEEELSRLWWGNLRFYDNAWHPAAPHPPPNVPPPIPAEVHVPEVHVPPPIPAEVHVPEVHVPPPNLAEVHVPEVHVPPQGPVDSDRESMVVDDDAPPASPESGHSYSPPTSPEWSTESEDWHTAPTSPGSSTSTGWDSDSDRWSTISNAPSAESLSENLKAADSEMRGKEKVSRRISGTTSSVDIGHGETRLRWRDGVAECG